MSRGRILVVDDEPDMREMLDYHLTEEGFEVDTVADGPAALLRMSARDFCLVLLDLHLPRMTGYQVLESIRARWPSQLVITVSSTVVGPAPTSAARADGHLDKPFELEELSEVVVEILDRARPGEASR